MRIVLAHSRYRVAGGEESYVERLLPALERAGHEVELLAVETPPDPPPLARAELLGRMLWSRDAARRMDELARRFRPHLLHAHNLYPNLSPSVLGAARAAGAGVVLHLHNARLVCPQGMLWSRGERCRRCVSTESAGMWQAVARDCRGSRSESAAYAAAIMLHRSIGAYDAVDAFVAPSRFLRDVLVQGGLPGARMHVVPHFVDAAPLANEPTAIEPPAEPYAIFAGRVAAEKGIAVLLEALRGAGFTLVVAGDGPLLASSRARAEAERLPVRFVGRLDRASLARLVAGARCAVAPSLVEESAGLAALEAIDAGVPVVASAAGGLVESVGDAGLLVPPGDAARLREALDRLFTDEELRRSLAARALARRPLHRLDDHLRRLDNVYAAAVARAASRR